MNVGDRVVLGLSGGVDSAVAARLLQRCGYEVFGLYLDNGCGEAGEDAKAAAENLNIPLEIRDISKEMAEKVCRPFVSAYLRGETPNPCILCNPEVKFKELLDFADSINAKNISTGHYARACGGHLYRGSPENDQSYMLSRLKKEQLERLVLPLGGYSKAEVRKLAEGFGLRAANRPASMEICFIPDGDYGAFIEKRGAVPPEGNFVDESGNVLGRHKGIHRYTVGQRRGLNIAAGRRIFVSEIRPETNEVVLSYGGGLMAQSIRVRDVNWLVPQPEPFRADIRIRHSRISYVGVVTPIGSGAELRFTEPVRAPAKGQSAVFYLGDEVAGGGFII